MQGRLAAGALMAIAISTRVPAQVQPDSSLLVIPAGSPIRVWTDSPAMSKRAAVAVTAAKDSFRIALDYSGYTTPLAVPYSALQRVDLLVPRSRAQGALRGFGFGLLTALAFDAVLAGYAGTQNHGDTDLFAAFVGVVGTPIIIAGGALIGAANPGEGWSVVYRRPVQ